MNHHCSPLVTIFYHYSPLISIFHNYSPVYTTMKENFEDARKGPWMGSVTLSLRLYGSAAKDNSGTIAAIMEGKGIPDFASRNKNTFLALRQNLHHCTFITACIVLAHIIIYICINSDMYTCTIGSYGSIILTILWARAPLQIHAAQDISWGDVHQILEIHLEVS